jgi:hypothetical protein
MVAVDRLGKPMQIATKRRRFAHHFLGRPD